MLHLIPAPVHRALLPIAYKFRQRWRRWRKTPIAGCTVIVTDLEGNLLLLRHSYGADAWAMPGGGMAAGENPEDAARREVLEEVGIDLGNLKSLGTMNEEVAHSSHTAYLFSAVTDAHPKPDMREVIEARFFPIHSLPEPLNNKTRARIKHWQDLRRGRPN